MAIADSLFSRDSDEWETPWPLFRWLDWSFTFTLDPCASEANHKCPLFYAIETDGLKQLWGGHRAFVNPPYSHIREWMAKCLHEARENDATVVALVAARTDTRWWQESVLGKANEIQFLPGRVKFLRPNRESVGAPFPSAVVVYRPPYRRSK